MTLCLMCYWRLVAQLFRSCVARLQTLKSEILWMMKDMEMLKRFLPVPENNVSIRSVSREFRINCSISSHVERIREMICHVLM